MSYDNSFFLPAPPGKEAAFFYKQRQHERKISKPTTSLDLAAIADVDNLVAVYETMKRENGTAPGPDGVRFCKVGQSELYEIMREAKKALISGAYRPGPARDVKIPKTGNRGFRTLSLRNLIDRVVAKAVNEAMAPFWERIFLNGSHGFRPDRSNWTLLAELGRRMAEQDRWALVSDDVTSAFPSVDLDRVIGDHTRYLGSNPLLLRLIDTIIRGGDQDRKIGMDQGCPYMPAALNVHLHHVFDIHAHALGNADRPTPWLRYADNLVVACQDVAEGQLVLENMTQLLGAVGLKLKGENNRQPVNLRQAQNLQLLGFTLYKSGQELGIKLGEAAWKKLRQNLLEAHETSNPALTAEASINGWMESYGPAFRKRPTGTVSFILKLASEYGFRELHSPEYYISSCQGAYLRWRTFSNVHKQRAKAELVGNLKQCG